MAKQVVKASRQRGSRQVGRWVGRQVGRKESGKGDKTGSMGNMAALFAHSNYVSMTDGVGRQTSLFLSCGKNGQEGFLQAASGPLFFFQRTAQFQKCK